MTSWRAWSRSEKAVAVRATVGAGLSYRAAAALLGTSAGAVAGYVHYNPAARAPLISGADGARMLLRLVALKAPARIDVNTPAPVAPVEASAPVAPVEAGAPADCPPEAGAPAEPMPPRQPRAGRVRGRRRWNDGFFVRTGPAGPSTVDADTRAAIDRALADGSKVTKLPPGHADGSMRTSYEDIG